MWLRMALALFVFAGVAGLTDARADTEYFTDLVEGQAAHAQRMASQRMPARYRLLQADLDGIRELMTAARDQGRATETVIALPDPAGGYTKFLVRPSSVLPEALAERYPNLFAMTGHALGAENTDVQMELTERGVSVQVLSPEGRWLLDPLVNEARGTTISYYAEDLGRPHDHSRCLLDSEPKARVQKPGADSAVKARSTDSTLRTYRLAVATTGEYAQFHGGTVGSALSAIVTTINRVNGIYARELSIQLTLVANNDDIVFTDPGSDPFTGNTNAGTLINESQSVIDANIGNANYDIGHTFSTGAGGLASLPSVCRTGLKARGVTGLPNPIGDAYDVDFVSHEIGHQFGGNHTFNSQVCSSNRNASTAYEPGGGSTIQAYAGICSSDNLQANSDPIFHAISFDEMIGYVQSDSRGACAATSATGNASPVVDAGTDFTVPAQTPLVLSGSATDADGDSLTYLWEQLDLGAPAALSAADDGQIPLFRVLTPVASGTRYLPALSSVVAGTSSNAEKIPQLSRAMDFRLTARDGEGGVASDDVIVNVSAAAGPFVLTAPNGGENVGANMTVTWSVAGTNAPPINADRVAFFLSTDGGASFAQAPFAEANNDGSAVIPMPANISTTSARLMIRGQDNIFYDVSNANFSIESGAGGSPVDAPIPWAAVPGDGSASLYFDGNGQGGRAFTAVCTPDSSTETPVSVANNTPTAIPDAVSNSVPSTIESTVVVTAGGQVPSSGPTVTVNISHTYRGDLSIALVSPAGTTVVLKNPASDSTNDVVGTYPTTLTPVSGLAAFAGEDAVGTWTLRISDNFTLDTGTLNAWSLDMTTETAQPDVQASGATSPLVLSGMTNGTPYDCAVSASEGGSDSVFVSAGLVVPGASAPATPSVSISEVDGGQVVLTLSPGSGPVPTGYRAICGDRVINAVGSAITIDGLDEQSSLACVVVAQAANGASVPSGSFDLVSELATGLPIWLLYEASQPR